MTNKAYIAREIDKPVELIMYVSNFDRTNLL